MKLTDKTRRLLARERALKRNWENQPPLRAGTWYELLYQCANGRKICNCGQAYETWFAPTRRTWRGFDGEVHLDTGHWGCKDGCQANQLNVRLQVAESILENGKAST